MKRKKVLLLFIISVVIALLVTGCTDNGEIDDGNRNGNIGGNDFVPPPPPPTDVGWLADGIIQSNEYDNSVVYSETFELYWSTDEEFIYVAIKAPTNGWVALGIHPQLISQRTVDFILGSVRDGEVVIYDQFGYEHPGVHSPDEDLGGTVDIEEFGGSEENGYTIIEFKRKLDTEDPYDYPLVQGLNTIRWSYGSQDALISGHVARGYGEITI